MRKPGIVVMVSMASMALAGCRSAMEPGPTRPGVICTAIAVSSLNVAVRDAATGQRVCDAAVVAIQGGDRYELRRTTSDPQTCGYAGPEERAGAFEVRATRPGYQAASAHVSVGADECHVIPVSLTVDLRPTP
jgi:hypothetical protein